LAIDAIDRFGSGPRTQDLDVLVLGSMSVLLSAQRGRVSGWLHRVAAVVHT